jgi:uncharacterized protein (DUF849 family)
MGLKNKVVLSCAITGSIHTPTMSPYLPTTPQLIARHAIDAAKAGASAVHIHARNPEDGRPSPDHGHFREIIETIRAESDVIICLTTGGGVGMSVEQRFSVVEAFKPELASCNMGSLNFSLHPMADQITSWKYEWEKVFVEQSKCNIFQNTFEDLEIACRMMKANGTKPELEIYDSGHLHSAEFLLSQGLLEPPLYFQFVMGILGGIRNPDIADVLHLKETADRLFGRDSYQWSAFGGGRSEFPLCTAAALMGGNCRVGMEDNLYLSKGRLAKSNAELVEKMVRILGEFSLVPATPDEARDILSLRKER